MRVGSKLFGPFDNVFVCQVGGGSEVEPVEETELGGWMSDIVGHEGERKTVDQQRDEES
jgi:hypothetical protein